MLLLPLNNVTPFGLAKKAPLRPNDHVVAALGGSNRDEQPGLHFSGRFFDKQIDIAKRHQSLAEFGSNPPDLMAEITQKRKTMMVCNKLPDGVPGVEALPPRYRGPPVGDIDPMDLNGHEGSA